MAALAQAVERQGRLATPGAEQLSLSAGTASGREVARRGGTGGRETTRAPLSERLRHERARGAAGATTRARTIVQRRGGEATLDELLVGAWEGLSAHRPIACPVCSQPMSPSSGAAGGACSDCGAQLR